MELAVVRTVRRSLQSPGVGFFIRFVLLADSSVCEPFQASCGRATGADRLSGHVVLLRAGNREACPDQTVQLHCSIPMHSTTAWYDTEIFIRFGLNVLALEFG